MSLFILTMFVVVLWQAYRRKASFSFASISQVAVGPRLAVAAAVTLVVVYAAQLELTAYQAAHDGIRDANFHRLPMALVYNSLEFGGIEHDLISAGIASLAIIETAALAILCLHVKSESPLRGLYIAVPASMLVLSLAAMTLTSSDVFYYAFYSTVGFHGYDPSTTFTPEYALINDYTRLLGTIYGPLWIALNYLAGSFGHTVVQKVVALRIANVILLFTALGILRGLRASKAAQVAFALNPMLWFYFVVNAHNDLMAIVPCLGGVLAVRRSRTAAVVLVAAAGCIKLPFLIVGCLAFSNVQKLTLRAVLILSAVSLCLAASWIFGGEPYLRHLTGYAHLRSTNNGSLITAAITTGALVVFALLAAAMLFNRFYSSAALLVASASPLLFPWYLSWGLPYALAGGKNVTAVLLALPLAAVLLDSVYRVDLLAFTIFTLSVSACAVNVLRDRRRFRSRVFPATKNA